MDDLTARVGHGTQEAGLDPRLQVLRVLEDDDSDILHYETRVNPAYAVPYAPGGMAGIQEKLAVVDKALSHAAHLNPMPTPASGERVRAAARTPRTYKGMKDYAAHRGNYATLQQHPTPALSKNQLARAHRITPRTIRQYVLLKQYRATLQAQLKEQTRALQTGFYPASGIINIYVPAAHINDRIGVTRREMTPAQRRAASESRAFGPDHYKILKMAGRTAELNAQLRAMKTYADDHPDAPKPKPPKAKSDEPKRSYRIVPRHPLLALAPTG